MLPRVAIEEFKKIYKKRFGVTLTDTEASFRANNLVNLYKAVLGSKLKAIEKKKVLPFSINDNI